MAHVLIVRDGRKLVPGGGQRGPAHSAQHYRVHLLEADHGHSRHLHHLYLLRLIPDPGVLALPAALLPSTDIRRSPETPYAYVKVLLPTVRLRAQARPPLRPLLICIILVHSLKLRRNQGLAARRDNFVVGVFTAVLLAMGLVLLLAYWLRRLVATEGFFKGLLFGEF